MNYHFLIPVWGEAYVNVFTEFSLPTQLSPGNLGAFVDEPNAVYRIMTRSVDIPHIKSSGSFQVLKRMMQTDFVLIDPYLGLRPYQIFSKCHELGIESCRDSIGDTAFFFGVADGVWSDGSLGRAKEIIGSGKRAVLVSGGFHVVRETFCPELSATFCRDGPPILSCPPRQLLGLAFKHVQIITSSMMWDNGEMINRLCAVLHWGLNETALLSRCWVFHPMAVRPRKHAAMVDLNGNPTTVDNAYVVQSGLDPSDFYFVTDSDDILLLEMSSCRYTQSEHTHFEVVVPGKYSPERVCEWLDVSTRGLPVDFMKEYYVQNHIWYHSEDLNDDAKRALEERSDEVIAEILQLDMERKACPSYIGAVKSLTRKCVKALVRPIGKALIRGGIKALILFRRWFPEEGRILGTWLDKRVEIAILAARRMHAPHILAALDYYLDGKAKASVSPDGGKTSRSADNDFTAHGLLKGKTASSGRPTITEERPDQPACGSTKSAHPEG